MLSQRRLLTYNVGPVGYAVTPQHESIRGMFSPNTIRLGIMMFLQFFVWGAWYVTAPRFLGTIGFGGGDFGWTYSVGPIAGIITPFFVGMIADRFFSTERILGVMHLTGGGLMLGATALMTAEKPSPALINLVFFGYMLTYYPTLSLTNTLAMHNMANSEKEFPLIRVFGTIGWIIAGVALSVFGWGDSIKMFYLTGGAALTLGLYSFTLPHTPPPSAGKKVTPAELIGLDAFVLFKRRSFLIFMISSFLICIPLAFYYQLAERTLAQGEIAFPPFKMTFGQMSEIIFMLLMPVFFARLGVKWMLFVGMLAWVARYGLFAFGAPDHVAWMLLIGVALHGICYDFFFVTGQIYTDKVASKEIRGQAQGMLVLFTLGFGMLIGAQFAGFVETRFTPQETAQLQAEAKSIDDAVTAQQKELDQHLKDGGEQFSNDFASQWREFAKPPSFSFLDLFLKTRTAPDDGQMKFNALAKERTAEKRGKANELSAALAKSQASSSATEADVKELEADLKNVRVAQSEALNAIAADQSQAAIDAAANAKSATITSALMQKQKIERLAGYRDALRTEALQAMQWRTIWLIPCILAGVIMALFAVAFKDDAGKTSVTEKEVAEAASMENQP